MNPSASGWLAVRIFGCLAAGYFMSYGLRSVNAVLAPELSADLGLTHSQLGSLSSAYFLAFALMQLPLGVWLDRFGPRRVNAVLMVLAGLGCACFAMAQSVSQLWMARAPVPYTPLTLSSHLRVFIHVCEVYIAE